MYLYEQDRSMLSVYQYLVNGPLSDCQFPNYSMNNIYDHGFFHNLVSGLFYRNVAIPFAIKMAQGSWTSAAVFRVSQ